MPGKRVITVSMYAGPLCGNVLRVEWWGQNGHLKRSGRHHLSEAAVRKVAKRLSSMRRGSFRPFLAGYPGWVWQPEHAPQRCE